MIQRFEAASYKRDSWNRLIEVSWSFRTVNGNAQRYSTKRSASEVSAMLT